MVVAKDKMREEHHILRIDKKADVEAINYSLEEILHEEIQTYTKLEFEQYMRQTKEQKVQT